ncbi:MAPEG family protein [Pseudooctadecabacter jejudonensis]|uniref:MAPEG family protein n=1 Tax=Pseudooctadecabacter jejudonensis TaxID=1391910 RepID=A0A1Y5RVP2_9RHOB|nr:MAPEG family protein [Pseudooctadecabacter jejudonensis]SLN26667.1 MAPEG family protein [Pseudooctadecabacter jejudonensis]
MTPDLTVLALAGLLQALQFGAYSVRANMDVGLGYSMSARDRAPSRPLSDQAGRLQRALNNHFEGLILFTLAVVCVELSDQNSAFTAACAFTYLGARLLYVPAYYFGLRPWRSVVWMVGFTATVLMLISALI